MPRVWGMTVAPTGTIGLPEVVVGHGPPAGREHLADALGHRVVRLQLDAHHRGHRLSGDVVVRGAQATAHDDRVGSVERLAQRGDDPGQVVAHLLLVVARRCRPRRAARRARPSWCRRSVRAAARSRPRPPRTTASPGSRQPWRRPAADCGSRHAFGRHPAGAQQVVRAGDDRQHDRDPQQREPEPLRRRPRSAGTARSRPPAAGRRVFSLATGVAGMLTPLAPANVR